MTEQRERVALITGAARGIGFAIAERLAPTARCILVDALPEVAEAAARLPGATGLVADVTDTAGIARLMERVAADFRRLDILVNNAGIHPPGRGPERASLEAITVEEWEFLLRVNLTGMFIVTQAALPLMRKGGWGRVINMSSRTGRTFTGTASVAYAVSKAGVIALTQQIAGTEGKNGITANCLAPGSIRSPLTEREGPEGIARRAARMAVGRIGETQDVAAAVAFLASDESGFITGATLDINGGSSMH